MYYCKSSLILFFFVTIQSFSQKEFSIESKIKYEIVKLTHDSNTKLISPVKGYFDYLSLQPVFQHKLNFGDFKVKSFDFSERALTKDESKYYKDSKATNEYLLNVRKQEQNSKVKNSLLLLNCIRKVNNEFYLITEFQIKLEKLPDTSSPRKSTFSNQSVLNDGSRWFKLGNFDAGIYKIDYN